MKRASMPTSWRGWLLIAILLTLPLAAFAGWKLVRARPDLPRYLKSEFNHLNRAREEKKQAALDYLKAQRDEARQAAQNPEVEAAFAGMLQVYRTGRLRTAQHRELEQAWDALYVRHLGGFYDVLLVDAEGTIFHSIKQERDLYRNILAPDFMHPGLAQALRAGLPDSQFVDFAYYSPSEEQAAFYVAPLPGHLGWLVLQVSLSAMNAILTQREGLGRTGEVYLVNRQRAMLTDSRFLAASPETSVFADTPAVREAFQQGDGNRITHDYRGRRVLSSFQMFQYEGATWAILAEKDESEVLTDFYREHEAALFPKLSAGLLAWPLSEIQEPAADFRTNGARESKVELKEWKKATGADALFTLGVSTCAAFLTLDPGKFVVLAHLTPTDAAYGAGWAEQMWLGRAHSRLVETVVERVFWRELPPAGRNRLQYALAATHANALRGTLNTLISQGVELRQIKALLQAEYETLSVWATSNPAQVRVKGSLRGQDAPRILNLADAPDLETALKRVVGG